MTTVRRLIDHDYSFGQGRADLADGLASVLQRCKTRLQQQHGEWFLDPDAGTDLPLGEPKNADALARVVRERVRQTDGVLSVARVDVRFVGRGAVVAVVVNTAFGLGEFDYFATPL